MYCGECGTENPDGNQFCRDCGKPLKKTQVPAVQSQDTPKTAAPVQVAERKPALAGKVLGILSIVCAGISWVAFPYIAGILAVLIGIGGFFQQQDKKSLFALLCIAGILIGLASIFVDIFYLSLFPAPHEILIEDF